jgi:hypothetical protein
LHDEQAVRLGARGPSLTAKVHLNLVDELPDELLGRVERITSLIVSRLREPAEVAGLAEKGQNDSTKEHSWRWKPNSFFDGYAGIGFAYSFFQLSDSLTSVPNGAATQFVIAAATATKLTPLKTNGLYSGVAGMAAAVRAASATEPCLGASAQELDGRLVARAMKQTRDSISGRSGVHLYDVVSGDAGVLRYLLSTQSRTPEVSAAITGMAMRLTWLLTARRTTGEPEWFVPPEALDPVVRNELPYGYYNLGMAHGVTGPLAALCAAWERGYRVDGQLAAIHSAASFLSRYHRSDQWGPLWPNRVSADAPIDPGKWRGIDLDTHGWCYGELGIARTLWASAQVTGDEEYLRLALLTYLGFLRRPIPKSLSMSPTICHGLAGVLVVVLRFISEQGLSELSVFYVQDLLERILRLADTSAPFVFRDVRISDGPVDDPGFLTGAAGVAMALSSVLDDTAAAWDWCLLIS